jgi:AcrR family transcriptional regulator
MESVAGAAGIAKGTVYLYFRSRADLLVALRQDYAAEMASVARAALLDHPEVPPRARWAGFAEVMLDFSLAHQSLHHALFRNEPVIEDDSMEPLRTVLREFLQDHVVEVALEPSSTEVLLRVLLDGLHGALVAVVHAGSEALGDVSRDDFLAVARLIGGALLAPGDKARHH